MPQSKLTSDQAVEVAATCAAHKVDYLFIGKSGAILLGYPATTQDVDIFLPKDRENAARMIRALKSIGFELSRRIQAKLLAGVDLIQLKGGPFDLDLIHAPDGSPVLSRLKSEQSFRTGSPWPICAISLPANEPATARRICWICSCWKSSAWSMRKRHAPPLATAAEEALGRAAASKKRSRK